eukprot:scaffold8403_cov52-Phaeocystis_antarctica.AAC.5
MRVTFASSISSVCGTATRLPRSSALASCHHNRREEARKLHLAILGRSTRGRRCHGRLVLGHLGHHVHEVCPAAAGVAARRAREEEPLQPLVAQLVGGHVHDLALLRSR